MAAAGGCRRAHRISARLGRLHSTSQGLTPVCNSVSLGVLALLRQSAMNGRTQKRRWTVVALHHFAGRAPCCQKWPRIEVIVHGSHEALI
mmetsp:Transcript_68488/g.207117  ORF Transcript_68488/g.207117 Transcript_68488/m.207117 type:complete len:90 (+) Transcript_68488:1242-1511(+)